MNFKSISRTDFSSISGFLVVFLYTYYLGSMFVGGDQSHYRLVYDSLRGLSFFEGYFFYKSIIYTDEFGHFAIVWLASQFFEKDLFNSLVNAALAYFSIKIFVGWGARPLIAFLLVVFGYYFLAMYVSAERLKYATLFFVLAIYYFDSKKILYPLLILSIVTHLQYLIPVFVYLVNRYLLVFGSSVVHLKIRSSDIIFLSTGFLGVLFFGSLFFDHIYSKVIAYHKSFDVFEYLRIVLFFLLSFYYSKNKFQVCFVFFILLMFVSIVGGMRINIFGYFVFLYYSLRVNGGLNVGVVSTFIYFLFGWLEYSQYVVSCGVNRPC